jgi:hypothetical protein
MSKEYLYVAVDESGTMANDEHFEVAACWYMSDKPPRAALKHTQESIQTQLEDTGSLPEGEREIKGKNLTSDGLDHLFGCLRDSGFEDSTVANNELPLGEASPVAYSFSGTDTDIARTVLNGGGRGTSAEESIRALLLLSVLNPLLYHGQFGDVDRDSVQVLLDSPVWQNAKERIESSQKVSDRAVEFEIWDSEKVPGIQFADVAANARFKRHSGETFNDAHEILKRLSL